MEVAIALAVVAILGAIALPAYRDYVTRAKLSEATDAIAPIQMELGQACLAKYLAGASNSTLGLASASAYATPTAVQSITAAGPSASQAKITVTLKAFGGVPAGSTLVYLGNCADNGVSWKLDGTSTLPSQFWPKG